MLGDSMVPLFGLSLPKVHLELVDHCHSLLRTGKTPTQHTEETDDYELFDHQIYKIWDELWRKL